MGVALLKLVLTLSIYLLSLVSVFAPNRLAGNPTWFSLGNMLASGVLLSGGLVHQLPDAAYVLDYPGAFPWAMFIAGLTMLCFFIMEESLHMFIGAHHEEIPDIHSLLHSHEHEHSHQSADDKSHDHAHDTEKTPLFHSTPPIPPPQPLVEGQFTRSVSCGHHGTECHSTRCSTTSIASLLPQHHHHDDHIDLHLHGSILASAVLMVAISVHSVLAGVSIGIETNPVTLTSTAIAILAHKSFEAFCLGSNLVTSQVEWRLNLILGITYTFTTPLGVILGVLLSDIDHGASSIAVVQAMVAGTFMYISIVEIASKELLACRTESSHGKRSETTAGIGKLICFVVGFLLMSSLAVYV